jgi:MraZ protein
MFSGAYEHSVDSKGRTVVPAKYRTKLGESFVMTRGLHGCLWIFPSKLWPDIQKSLVPRALLDARRIKLERYFVGSAVECTPDRQGRIAIPPMLLAHAGISPESGIWLVGLTDKIEVWNKDRWEEFNSSMTEEEIERLSTEAPPETTDAGA